MTTTSGSFSGGIEQADVGELTDHAEVEKDGATAAAFEVHMSWTRDARRQLAAAHDFIANNSVASADAILAVLHGRRKWPKHY